MCETEGGGGPADGGSDPGVQHVDGGGQTPETATRPRGDSKISI